VNQVGVIIAINVSTKLRYFLDRNAGKYKSQNSFDLSSVGADSELALMAS